MRKKDKFLIVLLTIITLGFIWVYWSVQNKKRASIKEDVTKAKLDSNVNVNELIDILQKDNIVKIENTLSKIKIYVNNINIVPKDKINTLKYVSGVLYSSNSIHLVVGEIATNLAKELQNKILS